MLVCSDVVRKQPLFRRLRAVPRVLFRHPGNYKPGVVPTPGVPSEADSRCFDGWTRAVSGVASTPDTVSPGCCFDTQGVLV